MITLTGTPRSTSHIYKYTCVGGRPRGYMSAEGKALKEQYFYEVKSQWKKKMIEDEVAVNIIYYFPDNRKRDADNFSKLILDSLIGVVLKDDSQITELHIFKEVDKENPRIEMSVV